MGKSDKKILYLMGIDWYWIKQRPQIIAEMLDKDYDVTAAYYKEVFLKLSLRQDKDELDKSYAIPAIPYRDKSKFAFLIQKFFFRVLIKKIKKFDIIWICHPLLFRYIPKDYSGKIVYDCMDNHEALCGDVKIRSMIHKTEKRLVQRANVIYASSNGLLEKMEHLGGGGKSVLVRNGFISQEIHEPVKPVHKEKYRIGYFGTIAEWMDFSLLLESLEKNPSVEYHLWGPAANIKIPQHPRIVMEGVIEHRQLWEKVKEMDCLIMPFQVNDIIRDVDPVKLYEYISMGKAVISVWYEEVERFRPFVYFYENGKQLHELLNDLCDENFKTNYTYLEQKAFLEQNSWSVRYYDMITMID